MFEFDFRSGTWRQRSRTAAHVSIVWEEKRNLAHLTWAWFVRLNPNLYTNNMPRRNTIKCEEGLQKRLISNIWHADKRKLWYTEYRFIIAVEVIFISIGMFINLACYISQTHTHTLSQNLTIMVCNVQTKVSFFIPVFFPDNQYSFILFILFITMTMKKRPLNSLNVSQGLNGICCFWHHSPQHVTPRANSLSQSLITLNPGLTLKRS